MNFFEKLNTVYRYKNSLICVGLDPYLDKFPKHIAALNSNIYEFNKAIIDVTADLVCAYKPQIAHYAAVGAEDQLKKTIDYIKKNHPEIPIILDAKRNDIGSTADMYAKEVFDRYGADAVTINPYLGLDGIKPFTKHTEKGIILLCRTSNPSASAIQNLRVGEKRLFEIIASMAANEWNENQNILLVVGATCPEELKAVRKIVGDMTLLVPGVGAQGGDAKAVVKNGQSSNGTGLIINASRSILYASSEKNFDIAARNMVIKMRDEINQYRTSIL